MILSFNKDVEEQKVSYTAGRDENVTITLENRLAVSYKFRTHLFYEAASVLLVIYPGKRKTSPHSLIQKCLAAALVPMANGNHVATP